MSKLKRMGFFALSALLLIAAQLAKVTAKSAVVEYDLTFGGGISYHYTYCSKATI